MSDAPRPASEELNLLRRRMDQNMLGTQKEHGDMLRSLNEKLAEVRMELRTHIQQEGMNPELIREMVSTLSVHSAQITAMEKMVMALWGAVFALAAGGVGWVIAHLSGHVMR